ncbi:unnamed protein product [Arabis nemorensis]|uniref:VWFA domain-containing protein n=1 Tax=Arabis nemorensis TaxID=586526 RepID=A0A565C6C8_9BRAS|nr:unnamed protein product [Arabis nemorensis]
MELVTSDAVERGIKWMNKNFVVADGTNMLPLLEKAVEMLSNTRDSIPMIFFLTDGSVEDERHICDVMKKRLASAGSVCPRIHTIGIFCNHYFLQMLANLSRGQHELAYNTDHIEERIDKLFTRALSTVLANLTMEPLQILDEVEVHPSDIPDLTSGSPLMIYGRYRGTFSENVKSRGLLGDLSSFSMTIAKLSIQTSVPSEYTRMIQLEITEEASKPSDNGGKKKVSFSTFIIFNDGSGESNATPPLENSNLPVRQVHTPSDRDLLLRFVSELFEEHFEHAFASTGSSIHCLAIKLGIERQNHRNLITLYGRQLDDADNRDSVIKAWRSSSG